MACERVPGREIGWGCECGGRAITTCMLSQHLRAGISITSCISG